MLEAEDDNSKNWQEQKTYFVFYKQLIVSILQFTEIVLRFLELESVRPNFPIRRFLVNLHRFGEILSRLED